MNRKGHREHIEHLGHKGTLPKEGTVSKIVVCLCNFYKKFWVKNKDTVLFTNRLGWKENSLKRNDQDPVKLYGKGAINFNETSAARIILSFE